MAEEEDTKPFDAVQGGYVDDRQPDPHLELGMKAGDGRVWLVKVRIPCSLQLCQLAAAQALDSPVTSIAAALL